MLPTVTGNGQSARNRSHYNLVRVFDSFGESWLFKDIQCEAELNLQVMLHKAGDISTIGGSSFYCLNFMSSRPVHVGAL